MTDTDRLIKDAVIDIIAITTIWSIFNNPYIGCSHFFNNKINTISCQIVIGFSISIYAIKKYM